jgi:hypothetical protein
MTLAAQGVNPAKLPNEKRCYGFERQGIFLRLKTNGKTRKIVDSFRSCHSASGLFFPAGAEIIVTDLVGATEFQSHVPSELIARYERTAKDRQEPAAELRAAGVPI